MGRSTIAGGVLLPAPFGDPGFAQDELEHPKGAEGGWSRWEVYPCGCCLRDGAMYRFDIIFVDFCRFF